MTVVNWIRTDARFGRENQIPNAYCKTIPVWDGIVRIILNEQLTDSFHTVETNPMTESEKLEKLVEERTQALVKENEALKASEERYHKMISEVQDYAIILLDKHGIIQNWNKGAERIKQYKESEVVGRPFHIFYLPQDRNIGLPEKLIREAQETGRASHEGWRLRKDQTRFWGSITITALHDNNNNIIGYSKVTRDLTERKLAEDKLKNIADELRHRNEELLESEERYHRMIDEIQDYAIILLSRDGTIENWNSGAQHIKGYRANEILGKNFRIFYPPEDVQSQLPERLLDEAVKTGRAIHEGWRVRKNGARFWGSIVITSLHDKRGEVIGFSKVTRDLTEKKIVEDRLKEYTHELELKNRDLEQFAYIASHDLQEPLRKIQTFSEIIQLRLQNDPSVAVYLDKINLSAQRMSDLIKSVMNYSRVSNSEREKTTDVNLNTILDNVLADFELLIQGKNARIESEELPIVKGIPLQMNQLFGNLIGNALKFTQQEPVIRITSRVVTGEEIIHKSHTLTAAQYYEISFADNGIGFEPEYADKIFEMFQRLHARHIFSGTGIGLALCKKIMENHGGYITAQSEPGQGATFYIYFPY